MKINLPSPATAIKSLAEVKNNYVEELVYTARHKQAYLYTERFLKGENSLNGYLHDSDKMVMFGLGMKRDTVRGIHRDISSHHPKYDYVPEPPLKNTVKNPFAMLCDLMCGQITKEYQKHGAKEFYFEHAPYKPVEGLDDMFVKYSDKIDEFQTKIDEGHEARRFVDVMVELVNEVGSSMQAKNTSSQIANKSQKSKNPFTTLYNKIFKPKFEDVH
ncbi:MAG: hypothetical protein R3Y28_06625 [Candidatus Gastranaerophilales bacterium]